MNEPSLSRSLYNLNETATHSIRLAVRRLAELGPGQEELQGALEGGGSETPNGPECSSFQHLFLLFSARCLSSSASEFLHSRCCNANHFFQTVRSSGESFTQHVSPASCQKPHSDVGKWIVSLVSAGSVHYSVVLSSKKYKSIISKIYLKTQQQ